MNQHDSELSALYRRSRDAAPGTQLDTAIRRHAAKAIGSGVQRRWPWAAAAVVLLSFSIMLRVVEQTPDAIRTDAPIPQTMAPHPGNSAAGPATPRPVDNDIADRRQQKTIDAASLDATLRHGTSREADEESIAADTAIEMKARPQQAIRSDAPMPQTMAAPAASTTPSPATPLAAGNGLSARRDQKAVDAALRQEAGREARRESIAADTASETKARLPKPPRRASEPPMPARKRAVLGAPAPVQAADAVAAESASASAIRTPRLRFDSQRLVRAGYEVTQSGDDEIRVQKDATPILVLRRAADQLTAEAYAGAEVYGVRAPWGAPPPAGRDCDAGNAGLLCQLSADVYGVYRKQALVMLRWRYRCE